MSEMQTQKPQTMQEKKKQAYQQHVEQTTPKYSLPLRMCKAFLIGGLICLIGQIMLVLVSVLLTGCNLYPKLVEWGGAGALVPITGFANSIASAAIEYQKEGQVFGIGCKIFTIAGPVILYGIFTSWCLGLLYWIGRLLNIV